MSSHMSAEEYIAAMHQDNQALRAENERLKERNALLENVVEAAPSAEMLTTLAAWFDMKYPDDANPEVQNDLRRLADSLAALERK